MITVLDAFKNITVEPILVHRKDNIKSIHKSLIMQDPPVCRCTYVIDDDKRIVGRITLKKIMNYVGIKKALTGSKAYSVYKLFQYISSDLIAEDLMEPAIIVDINQLLEEAFELMLNNNVEEAAVLDKDGCVIGDLNIYEVLRKIEID